MRKRNGAPPGHDVRPIVKFQPIRMLRPVASRPLRIPGRLPRRYQPLCLFRDDSRPRRRLLCKLRPVPTDRIHLLRRAVEIAAQRGSFGMR